MCKAHDFQEKTWRHLNFFQHHCYITAKIPRTRCPDHGVKSVKAPWARKGSKFTLLFEQAALMLVRHMPVGPAAAHMGITDNSLWRIVFHYVDKAMEGLDLSFVHRIAVAVCDMSKAFISGIEESFPNSETVVDWFHMVKQFNTALDQVRRKESRQGSMPSGVRWAVLKAADGELTEYQKALLAELEDFAKDTAVAWWIKEMLRLVNMAATSLAACWRLSRFINFALDLIKGSTNLTPIQKALKTVERHRDRILARWGNDYTNARLESLNGLFQAARARARGYRNINTFITMIYLIAAPIDHILKST